MKNKKTKPKQGKPTRFNQALAEQILDGIREGETLVSIAKKRDMPAIRTLEGWLYNVAGSGFLLDDYSDELEQKLVVFRTRYFLARQVRLEHMLDEIIAISDDDSSDVLGKDDENQRGNSAAIQRATLRVNSRKWVIERELERIAAQITKFQVQVEQSTKFNIEDMTKEEREALRLLATNLAEQEQATTH